MITTKEFLELLAGSSSAGIVDEWDNLHASEPILRKNAARILHMYLLKVLKEPDGSEQGPSWKLVKDIYDCRVCANHIAQVVDKGIMEPHRYSEDFTVFEGNGTMERAEAEACVKRLFDEKLRLRPCN